MKILFHFRELGPDEKIEKGDMHSLEGSALWPIFNEDTVGMTPKDRGLNRGRKWYRITSQESMD